MTKTTSKTKIAVTVGVLLAGGAAAFAMLNANVGSGYKNFYVLCHDGSWMVDNEIDGNQAAFRGGTDPGWGGTTNGCQPKSFWEESAQSFCQNKRNPETGKVGINTYKLTERCQLPAERYGYGYGYRPAPTPPPSYGYNNAINKLKQAVPSSASQRN
ncbi:MAG: hypothetical protein KBD15_00450 [Candidatus Magasanikbacteria bacterium]|jgi:hypothetical protein|nr:hypothetical protein [Candidatus Magasanikbacteria bacterium]